MAAQRLSASSRLGEVNMGIKVPVVETETMETLTRLYHRHHKAGIGAKMRSIGTNISVISTKDKIDASESRWSTVTKLMFLVENVACADVNPPNGVFPLEMTIRRSVTLMGGVS